MENLLNFQHINLFEGTLTSDDITWLELAFNSFTDAAIRLNITLNSISESIIKNSETLEALNNIADSLSEIHNELKSINISQTDSNSSLEQGVASNLISMSIGVGVKELYNLLKPYLQKAGKLSIKAIGRGGLAALASEYALIMHDAYQYQETGESPNKEIWDKLGEKIEEFRALDKEITDKMSAWAEPFYAEHLEPIGLALEQWKADRFQDIKDVFGIPSPITPPSYLSPGTVHLFQPRHQSEIDGEQPNDINSLLSTPRHLRPLSIIPPIPTPLIQDTIRQFGRGVMDIFDPQLHSFASPVYHETYQETHNDNRRYEVRVEVSPKTNEPAATAFAMGEELRRLLET